MLDRLGIDEARRRCIEMDAPSVEDYSDRLSDAVIGGEIVCGFSLGALVVAHNLAALARAKAVVLLACNPLPDHAGNRRARELARDRVLAGDAKGWVTENWQTMSASSDAALREQVIEMATATRHLIPAQTELAVSRPGACAALAATDLPLVFVTGTDDRLTPPDPIRGLVPGAGRATLAALDGLGHFALLEAPDRVAKAVLRGLKLVLAETNNESQTHDTSDNPFHAA